MWQAEVSEAPRYKEPNAADLVEEPDEDRPGHQRIGEQHDAEHQRLRLFPGDEFLPEDGKQHQDRDAQQAQPRRLDDVKVTLAPLFLFRALVGIWVEDFVRDGRRIPDKSTREVSGTIAVRCSLTRAR